MKTELTTKIWGDTYGVRADWSQAGDIVETLVGDGEWITSPMQVANYQHRANAALKSHLEDVAASSGDLDGKAESEIEKAVSRAVYGDENR